MHLNSKIKGIKEFSTLDLDLGLLKFFDDLGMENMGVRPLLCKLSIDSVVKELC